jgi:hypothetical protein
VIDALEALVFVHSTMLDIWSTTEGYFKNCPKDHISDYQRMYHKIKVKGEFLCSCASILMVFYYNNANKISAELNNA